jgi:hypothetical protein
MISQRRAVQLGVISATAVFAACIGVLVFQGGDSSAAPGSKTQMVDSPASQSGSNPLSLSAAATPVAQVQTSRH